MRRDEGRIRLHLDPRFFCRNAWRMDGLTNKAADSAASGEATPETSPPSGGEPLPPDFPVPRTGEDGRPIYDQEFFLALARRGKEVWNSWRAENLKVEDQPYIRITFEGVDFREPENSVIDFSGFDFGHEANLCGCQFGDGREPWDGKVLFRPSVGKFTGAYFGSFGSFKHATFGRWTDFSAVTIGDQAHFSGAMFGRDTSFAGATFLGYTSFSTAHFGRDANFSTTIFKGPTDFSEASFSRINFSGVVLTPFASFSGATFGGGAVFKGWSKDEWMRCRSSLIEESETLKAWPPERRKLVSERVSRIGEGRTEHIHQSPLQLGGIFWPS